MSWARASTPSASAAELAELEIVTESRVRIAGGAGASSASRTWGREVGDWETRFSSMTIGALRLVTDDGGTGTRFFSGRPLPAATRLADALARDPSVSSAGIEVGSYTAAGPDPWAPPDSVDAVWGPILRLQVDQALWDLQAQSSGLPLFRLLGGNDPRVRVYASGLDFHMTTDQACAHSSPPPATGDSPHSS